MPPAPSPSVVLAAALGGGMGVVLGAFGALLLGPASVADTFEAVAPSVVNVSVEGTTVHVGSGFAIAPDEVVTARHLVLEGEQVLVRDVSGRTLPAAVVGTDARTDLALLSVPGAGFAPVVLGDSDLLRVGDPVLAIGNPYGLGHSLSVGVVGGRGRRIDGDAPSVDFLQLSIPLNPGNSGGPVFDAGGRAIGVLSGTHAQGQAIAFVTPSDALVASLPALRAGERVSRAFLGIRVETDGEGVVITNVVPSSPADRAGLRTGDHLTALANVPLTAPSDLSDALDRLSGGSRVSARLLRDGGPRLVDVILADWAEQPVVIGGMTLRPAPGAGGEVVAIRPRSRAERAGVRVGDVVRAVDGAPVRAPADVRDALADGAPAQLDVLREGSPVAVQLGEPG